MRQEEEQECIEESRPQLTQQEILLRKTKEYLAEFYKASQKLSSGSNPHQPCKTEEVKEITKLTQHLQQISIKEEKQESVAPSIESGLRLINQLEVSSIVGQQDNEWAIQSTHESMPLEKSSLTVVMDWLEKELAQNEKRVKSSCQLKRPKPILQISKIVGFFKPKQIVFVIANLGNLEQKNILFSLKQAKMHFPIKLKTFFNSCLSKCQTMLKAEISEEEEKGFLDELLGSNWEVGGESKGIVSGESEVVFVGQGVGRRGLGEGKMWSE